MSKSLGTTTLSLSIILLNEWLCDFQAPESDLETATLISYCDLFDNASFLYSW